MPPKFIELETAKGPAMCLQSFDNTLQALAGTLPRRKCPCQQVGISVPLSGIAANHAVSISDGIPTFQSNGIAPPYDYADS